MNEPKLSLDEFAARAMQSLIHDISTIHKPIEGARSPYLMRKYSRLMKEYEIIAREAYELAATMIKVREEITNEKPTDK